jgi:y4mF family transcriptional regulator
MSTSKSDVPVVSVQAITPHELRRRASTPAQPSLQAGSAGGTAAASTGLANPGSAGGFVISTTADLGRLVRTARERMGLNQQQLADLAGVGRRFLSELENGKSTSEFGLVLRVCQAAGIDVVAKSRQL